MFPRSGFSPTAPAPVPCAGRNANECTRGPHANPNHLTEIDRFPIALREQVRSSTFAFDDVSSPLQVAKRTSIRAWTLAPLYGAVASETGSNRGGFEVEEHYQRIMQSAAREWLKPFGENTSICGDVLQIIANITTIGRYHPSAGRQQRPPAQTTDREVSRAAPAQSSSASSPSSRARRTASPRLRTPSFTNSLRM